jgi:hypothetical protein
LKELRETIMISHNLVQGGLQFASHDEKVVVVIKSVLGLLLTKHMPYVKQLPIVGLLPHVLMSLHFLRVGGEVMRSSLIPSEIINMYGDSLVKLAGIFGLFLESISKLIVMGGIAVTTQTATLLNSKLHKKPSLNRFAKFFEKLPEHLQKLVIQKSKQYFSTTLSGRTVYDEDRLQYFYIYFIPSLNL